MAKSIVELTVEDGGFNQKLKNAADAMKRFGDSLANAAANGLSQFAQGLKTARQAQQALNDTVKANLYVLAATAIVEAGKALYDWASGAYEAEAAQRKLNVEIENTKLAIDNMTADIDFDIRIAKAAGKSVDEMLKMRKAAAQARLELADANYDKITALGSKATKEQIAEATSMQEAAWQNMRKVLEDMTINDVQKRNATGPYKVKSTGGRSSVSRTPTEKDPFTEMEEITGLINIQEQKLQDLKNIKAFAETEDEIVSLNQQIKEANEEYQRLLNLGNEPIEDPFTPALSPLQQLNEELKTLREQLELAPNTDAYKEALQAISEKEMEIKKFKGETDNNTESKSNDFESSKKLVNGLSSVASGLRQMGVKLPDGIQKFIGGIQGLMSVIQGVQSVIQVLSTSSMTAQVASQTANTTALAALTTAVMANTSALYVKAFTPSFARGGIVPHAAGGWMVPGHDYSDRTPVMVSSGELILNKAQQGNLASQLEGGALGNLRLTATISGEQIRLALNNNGRRTGRGEMITAKFGG